MSNLEIAAINRLVAIGGEMARRDVEGLSPLFIADSTDVQSEHADCPRTRFVELPRGSQRFRALDIDSMRQMIDMARMPGDVCCVFFSEFSVDARISRHDTRAQTSIVIELQQSPMFEILRALRDTGTEDAPQTHREFVRMLQTDLNGCVPDEFLVATRSIRMQKSSDVASSMGAGKVHVAHSLQSSLSSADGASLPESLVLSVPVYVDPDDYTARVDCSVVIDHEEAKIWMRPKAGELEKARRWTLAQIMQDAKLLLDQTQDGDVGTICVLGSAPVLV
jgi:hypothetical protein